MIAPKVVLRDALQQPSLASTGAVASAAIPQADTYLADEDNEEDAKEADTI